MSAFDDYLAQLRRLDEVRRGADEAAARSASQAESLAQRCERLTEQAAAQRAAIGELARAARVETPPTAPRQPLGGDPAMEIDAAEADLRRAAAEIDDARYLAHRPPWLPRWRADERNGLVYGLWAVAALLAQFIVMRVWNGLGQGGVGPLELVGLIVVVVAVPLVAFALGWLTIGLAARPRIADDDKRLERNFRLGLVLCGSTLLVALFGYFA